MTNPPRVTDILAAHREIPNEHGASCTCGEWQAIRIPGGVDTVGWSHATHQIDALNEAGFEVVKSQPPMERAAVTDIRCDGCHGCPDPWNCK